MTKGERGLLLSLSQLSNLVDLLTAWDGFWKLNSLSLPHTELESPSVNQDVASTSPKGSCPWNILVGPTTRVEGGRLGPAVGKVDWPSGTSGRGEVLREQTLCPSLARPFSTVNVDGRPPALQVLTNLEGALLVPVLQVARGQKVTSLTACLVDQSLRLDCRHENTTNLPIQYEFSLTRETKKHVLFGTIGVPEHAYRSRTNFFSKYNLKVLYLSGFTTKDEGTYTCALHLSGQTPIVSNRNVSVLRGEANPQQDQGSWERQAGEERAGWDSWQSPWLGHNREWPHNFSLLPPTAACAWGNRYLQHEWGKG